MANHLSKRYLHKSIVWELGLLTYCIQAEEKKKTGIQLIRVTDANGNTYQRYYDFDKGEFAKNPNPEMPKEELKNYRGLRKKDINSSIASLNYLSLNKAFDGKEEELWGEVQKEIDDLTPEQEAETTKILDQLTATNSGWSMGMKILGDQVNLGFEDGLKAIKKNVNKGLAATGTALNTMWEGIKNNKALKDGVLLAGSLLGSVASAVKGYSILSGGLEGLATKSLLAGVGLEFAAVALGSYFVGQSIKMLVLPKIEEWKKAHPPKSELEKMEEKTRRLQEKIKGKQKKQLAKDLENDSKLIVNSIQDANKFIKGLAYSEISWSQQLIERVEKNEEKVVNQRKIDTSKGLQKINPFAYVNNIGVDLGKVVVDKISDDTEKHAYQDLLIKVENKELLLEDSKKIEALDKTLTEIEKTLDKREATLNKLDFEPEDKTQLLERINEGRSAIASQRLELYSAMFTESELIRDTDNYETHMAILDKANILAPNSTGFAIVAKSKKLERAMQNLWAQKLNERNFEIPGEEGFREKLEGADYLYVMNQYEDIVSTVELYEKLVENSNPLSFGYQATLNKAKEKLKQYEAVTEVVKELETATELQELRDEIEMLTKKREVETETLNNLSLDYKTKLDEIVSKMEATSEEVADVTSNSTS